MVPKRSRMTLQQLFRQSCGLIGWKGTKESSTSSGLLKKQFGELCGGNYVLGLQCKKQRHFIFRTFMLQLTFIVKPQQAT